ncbi:MAG: hypothetical protein ACOH12_14580 [Parvibaculaceae bacterium]
MAETGAKIPQNRSFMGASIGFRLALAAVCLVALWCGVWWAMAI